jgi:phosphoribosyl-ATP pyrophosphohydrolase/phosphoribosyl-AMP cyclohydrolase/histidinol dehydrogenase
MNNTPDFYFPLRTPESLPAKREQSYDDKTLEIAKSILSDIRTRGLEAAREHAIRLGDIKEGEQIFYSRADLEFALAALPQENIALLRRVATRIENFAKAQKETLSSLQYPVPGGFVGHDILPVDVAGCYAPAGRFPLPSTILMTVIPARVAGVQNVFVACPKPPPIMLAAAAIAGADGLLAIGGAHAIGSLAYGTEYNSAADVIVGPGSRWVTAAKRLIAGEISIDMLAGPSELVVLADDTADADVIAADLLAQAEHDPDAEPILITPSRILYDKVISAIGRQLSDLPTAATAIQALSKGGAVLVKDIDEGIAICNYFAGEHLEVMTENPQEVSKKLRHCGGLFIGQNSAEVIGDYGCGPNHTLPTGGTARSRGGLSVFNFLRVRTWIDIENADSATDLYKDSRDLARIEGLEAHARAAEMRLKKFDPT